MRKYLHYGSTESNISKDSMEALAETVRELFIKNVIPAGGMEEQKAGRGIWIASNNGIAYILAKDLKQIAHLRGGEDHIAFKEMMNRVAEIDIEREAGVFVDMMDLMGINMFIVFSVEENLE